jgi:acyl-coenzyme A thioesterase PaaI-like protein
LHAWPGGRRLFSFIVGRLAPYSGSIRAVVEQLEPGYVVLTMADRRSVRNHLSSIHAIALTNLGELASGLALLADLPPGSRGIVTGIEVEFSKKARGRLVATGTARAPGLDELAERDRSCLARAEILDAERDAVAVVHVEWRVGLGRSTDGTALPQERFPN